MAHAPFLFSLHPRWAAAVFDGTKTLEVRKRFLSDSAFPAMAAVYATGPGGGVVGLLRATGQRRVDRAALEGPLAQATQVPSDLLDTYLGGQETATVVALARPTRFTQALSLDGLRALGHTPPQLATFVKPEAWNALATRPVFGTQGRVWRFRPVDVSTLPLASPVLARPLSLYAPAFDAWWGKVQAEQRPCYGVDVDGALAALAVLKPTGPGTVQLCLFHSLAHGQGIGGFLLDRLLATLQMDGTRALTGEVLATEKATQAWFVRQGFALEDRDDLPNGHKGLLFRFS